MTVPTTSPKTQPTSRVKAEDPIRVFMLKFPFRAACPEAQTATITIYKKSDGSLNTGAIRDNVISFQSDGQQYEVRDEEFDGEPRRRVEAVCAARSVVPAGEDGAADDIR